MIVLGTVPCLVCMMVLKCVVRLGLAQQQLPLRAQRLTIPGTDLGLSSFRKWITRGLRKVMYIMYQHRYVVVMMRAQNFIEYQSWKWPFAVYPLLAQLAVVQCIILLIGRRLIDQGYEQLWAKSQKVLADGSKITVDQMYHILIQFCKQITQAVLCHVLENFSSCFILGMQWLTNTYPTIYWLEHKIDLQYGQSVVTLKGQAEKRRLPRVELCSGKAGIKAIHKGEQMWFMILCAPDVAHPPGIDSKQGNGTVVHDLSGNPALACKLQALLIEYADIFEQPGKPESRLVDHYINMIDPNAVPLKPLL